MKKLLLALLFVSFIWADTVGYLDSQKILQEYNKSIAAQAEISVQQKEFQELFLKKQAEYEEKKLHSNMSEEELAQLKLDLEEELLPKREALLKLNQELSSAIEKSVIEATKKVAKQLRIDVVLDKQVVLVGGMDITSMVLSNLNN